MPTAAGEEANTRLDLEEARLVRVGAEAAWPRPTSERLYMPTRDGQNGLVASRLATSCKRSVSSRGCEKLQVRQRAVARTARWIQGHARQRDQKASRVTRKLAPQLASESLPRSLRELRRETRLPNSRGVPLLVDGRIAEGRLEHFGFIRTLYWALSGYGERPRRAFGWLAAMFAPREAPTRELLVEAGGRSQKTKI